MGVFIRTLPIWICCLFSLQSIASELSCRELFEEYILDLYKYPQQKPLVEKKDLRILSWNLQDFFVKQIGIGKNQIDQGYMGVKNKKRSRVKGILRQIQYVQPDILVLNEVVGEHSTRSLDPKGKYQHITNTPKDQRNIATVFLVSKRLHVDIELILPEAKTERIHLERGVPIIALRQKKTDGSVDKNRIPDLYIMGVHLKSPARVSEKSYKIIKQDEAMLISNAVRDLEAKHPETPIILVGDLNIHLSGASNVNQIRQIMKEALEIEAPISSGNNDYTHVFYNKSRTFFQKFDSLLFNYRAEPMFKGIRTLPFLHPNGEIKTYIDHDGGRIFYPPTKEEAAKEVSDHRPIVSVFDMTL